MKKHATAILLGLALAGAVGMSATAADRADRGPPDGGRDMVMPGAFAKTLSLRGIRRIPMLFQHDPAEPIGIWQELTEDWRGLRVRGRLIPDVVRARELLALTRLAAADIALSLGYASPSAFNRAFRRWSGTTPNW